MYIIRTVIKKNCIKPKSIKNKCKKHMEILKKPNWTFKAKYKSE